ncbi:MAG: PilT/PilU family type 4a pilus ATPase [Selenomonadaceae bacterium]|nr:PilT/PilU family type 4a pilus ATPase [Selenomonadaceae bacterium]
MEVFHMVERAIRCGASDLHLCAGQRAGMRVDGRLALQDEIPEEREMRRFAEAVLSEGQRDILKRRKQLDFSWGYQKRRFRGNAYRQQGRLAFALRLLPARIPTLTEIGAPRALTDFLDAGHGLLLVTGRTGSGKTTTLAAFLDAVNHRAARHILTLEDPVEYVLQPDQCFISQRELGQDFSSFAEGLRAGLREMPDVILVGEIRDAETMRTAMAAAASGALVLGTLHTRDAASAPLRIEGMFPLGERDAVRAELSEVLSGVFAQWLLPARTGGRVCLFEVLLVDPAVRSLIRQGKYAQIPSAMLRSPVMRTRERAAQELARQGKIRPVTLAAFLDGQTGQMS